MDTKKITITLLIVVGVVYIGGLTTNLTKSDNKKSNENDSFDLSKNKWVETLSNIMPNFNDKLDSVRVLPIQCKIKNNLKSNPPPGTKSYQLNTSKACSISIGAKPNSDIQDLIISVQDKVIVLRPCGKNETPVNRGLAIKFKPSVMIAMKKPINNRRRPTVQKLSLLIEYTPKGKSKLAPKCQAKLPYKIPIFSEGGTLILTCKACTAQRKVNVSFK